LNFAGLYIQQSGGSTVSTHGPTLVDSVTFSPVEDPARAVTLNGDNGWFADLAADYFQAGEQVRVTATSSANVALAGDVVEVPPTVRFTALPVGWPNVDEPAGGGGAPGVAGGGAGGSAEEPGDLRSGTMHFAWQADGPGELEVVYASVFQPDFYGTALIATCRVPLSDGAFTLPPPIADLELGSSLPIGLTAVNEHEAALIDAEPKFLLRATRKLLVLNPPPR